MVTQSAQFSDLRGVVACICTRACNDESRGDIRRRSLTAHFSIYGLLVKLKRGSAYKQDDYRCGKLLELYNLLGALRIPVEAQFSDLSMVNGS